MTPKEIEKYYKDKAACDAIRPIRRSIAFRMGIRNKDWFTRQHQPQLVKARETVAYIARVKYDLKFDVIAIVCGWQNHTSAAAAYARIAADPERIKECELAWRSVKGAVA